MSEVRYYKGKWQVEIVLKSKGNYRVKALEDFQVDRWVVKKGEEFTTVPRLLWRKKRGAKTK